MEERMIEPLSELFKLIYRDRVIPGQWLISKIVPVHKKGDKSVIENYRPVANLCSVSKIFEKLILKKINELEIINGVSVGGKQQHGFMKSIHDTDFPNGSLKLFNIIFQFEIVPTAI